MNANHLETEALINTLLNANLQLESTGFSVEAIVSTRSKMNSESARNIYLVSNQSMFERSLELPGMIDMFDPQCRVSEIEAGRMGTFLGMDVLINEKVPENCFSIVVRDFKGELTSACMRVIDQKEHDDTGT